MSSFDLADVDLLWLSMYTASNFLEIPMFTDRSEILFGADGIKKLANSTVAIFGLGGVGAAVAMDLVRAGVGSLIITDFDTVEESNLNRLVIGFSDTVGRSKVDVIKEMGMKKGSELLIEHLRHTW